MVSLPLTLVYCATGILLLMLFSYGGEECKIAAEWLLEAEPLLKCTKKNPKRYLKIILLLVNSMSLIHQLEDIVEDIVFNTVMLSLYPGLLGPCSVRFVLMHEYRKTTRASGEIWSPAGGCFCTCDCVSI